MLIDMGVPFVENDSSAAAILAAKMQVNVRRVIQIGRTMPDWRFYPENGAALSELAGEYSQLHADLVRSQHVEDSEIDFGQTRPVEPIRRSDALQWEETRDRLEKMISTQSTAEVVEKSPQHEVCQDEALAFTYGARGIPAVIVSDGISTAFPSMEKYSAQAAQAVVSAFRATFEDGASKLLYSAEARQLAIKAYDVAVALIEDVIARSREEILHDTTLDQTQKTEMITQLPSIGATLNFQTLCIDAETNKLAVLSANMGDSRGSMLYPDIVRAAYKSRHTTRDRLMDEAYEQITKLDKYRHSNTITRSVRGRQREEFISSGIGIRDIPDGTTEILLLSRSDALDKLPIYQDRWIVERLFDAFRSENRARRSQRMVPLSKRMVDSLLRGVKREWAMPRLMSAKSPYDDVSFAMAHVGFS